MCQECGCGKPGPTRIDGKPAEEVESPLVPATGESTPGSYVHSHPHSHEHDHDHDQGHGAGHSHSHTHEHAHEHRHRHEEPHDAPHSHDHAHDLAHAHEHSTEAGQDHPHPRRTVDVHQTVLAANDRLAERNRGYFRGLGLLVLNVASSPGSGKTEFIRQTIATLGRRLKVGVIVGDLETDRDAQRLRATGAPAVQITTGTLCHLDAEMVARAIGSLPAKTLELLIIENVGNLVCPAAFDLGESLRVALLAVTEGEDKPLKYPPMFHSAQVVVVNKTDLAEAAAFDREAALANIRRVSPDARIFEVSARTGQGMEEWCQYLLQARATLS